MRSMDLLLFILILVVNAGCQNMTSTRADEHVAGKDYVPRSVLAILDSVKDTGAGETLRRAIATVPNDAALVVIESVSVHGGYNQATQSFDSDSLGIGSYGWLGVFAAPDTTGYFSNLAYADVGPYLGGGYTFEGVRAVTVCGGREDSPALANLYRNIHSVVDELNPYATLDASSDDGTMIVRIYLRAGGKETTRVLVNMQHDDDVLATVAVLSHASLNAIEERTQRK